MFPWWISWLLRWWTCTVCSLTILLAFSQPVSPVGFDWVEETPYRPLYNESSKEMKFPLRDEFSIKMRKNPSKINFFNKGEFNYENYHYEHSKSYPFEGIMPTLHDNFNYDKTVENSPFEKSFKRTKLNVVGVKPKKGHLHHTIGESEYFMDNPSDEEGETKMKSKSPHLNSHRDITSFEVPFVPRGNELRGNRLEMMNSKTVSSKEKRTPVSKKASHVISTTKKRNKHSHTGKRIMKTLVTTPKRIRGSLQGMGGSAVKPVGSSVQQFATEPAPQTGVVGSTAVLPCRVMGKVGHLQWTKDGFGLGTDRDLFGFSRYSMIGDDDEGDYSLRIQPVLLDDDALFQCQVSAIDGIPGIRSKPVRLTVYVPPEPPQVSPPVLETTAGEIVTLECTSIGGRPPPEIQWVDDSRRESIHKSSAVTSELMGDRKRSIVRSRLSFTAKRRHNNQTVTCVTSNQALSSPLTSSVFLSVMFLPEIQLTSHPQTLIEGDDVAFLCDVYANPSLVTYRWFLNGLSIANKTSRALRLEKISRSLHQNKIACEVSNRVGTLKKSRNITVRYGPTFRSMPRDVMTEEGEEAILKCNVDSNPGASIVWLRKGSNKIIGLGPSFTIRVNSSSAGLYKCIARVRGRDFEFPELVGHLRLLLKGPPTIISDSEQQGRLGDTVSIVCSTVSVPSPIRVTWTYNGKEINLNDPRYEVVEDEGKERLRNILVIHDAASSDFGAYNCSVVNEYGVARKLITLQPEKRIPVVFVVGCAITVVVIAVVVLSLVFCNKRHAVKANSKSIQGNVYGFLGRRSVRFPDSSTRPEKALPEVTQTSESHMYNVPAETKLIEENATLGVSQPGLRISPLHSNRQYSIDRRKSYQQETISGSSLLHSLSGEIDHKIHSEQVTFEDDYLSCRSQSQTNVNFPMDELGRRTMTQTSLLTTSPQKYVGSTSPDYSSLRRASHTYGMQRNHHLSPQHNGHLGNLGLSKTPLIANGSTTIYSSPKRSPYSSPSSGAWSPIPLPPPYPRNTSSVANGRLVNVSDEGRPTSRLTNSVTRNSETKLLYTPGSKLVSDFVRSSLKRISQRSQEKWRRLRPICAEFLRRIRVNSDNFRPAYSLDLTLRLLLPVLKFESFDNDEEEEEEDLITAVEEYSSWMSRINVSPFFLDFID